MPVLKMKKSSYLILPLVLLLGANGEPSYYDYDYNHDYDFCEGSDNCAIYSSMDESCACHHRQFPNETLEERFGDNVRKCCDFHGHKHYLNNCEDHGMHLNGKEVCQAPDSSTPKLYDPIDCPKHCRVYDFHGEDFDVVKSGNLVINGTMLIQRRLQNLDQLNHCVSYECIDNEKWGIKASVCLCPGKEELRKVDKTVSPAIKRCCGSSPKYNENCETDTLDIVHLDSRKPCHSVSNYEIDGSTIKFGTKDIPIDSPDICIGPTIGRKGLKMTLFECIQPCNGNVPCIRTCHANPDQIVTKEIKNLVGQNSFNNEINLDVAHNLERRCAKGYIQQTVKLECDNFDLKKNSRNEYDLWFDNVIYPPDSFCLDNHETDLIATMCVKDVKQSIQDKYEFYPYLLLISCFFLFLTIIIYTAWPKLLSQYTRIMRHYTLNLFFAFIILAINQFHTLKDVNLGLCIASGFFIQYFFVASFALMTTLNFELWKTLHGSQQDDRRYRLQLCFGYGIPLLISILTIIVEFSTDKCFPIKPRFGDDKCFFGDELSKGIWLYLPIGLMLLVNFVMFVFIVVYIHALDKRQKDFNVTPGKRDVMAERMNRFLLFLKLFIIMGFIWIFDIISGLIGDKAIPEHHWYITDCLNMLQGVFVFIIFVCKRNVFNVVFQRVKIVTRSLNDSNGILLQIESTNKNSSMNGIDTLDTNVFNRQSTA